MEIRDYKESDIISVVKLFYDTVHEINSRDYSHEQIDVWAGENIDLDIWNESLTKHHTLIALDGPTIVGFGDIDGTGYLDRLYVHHKYQRQGIGTRLCDELESSINVDTIIVHASITAKPFFEQRGYQVLKKNTVNKNGILLTNYIMCLERNSM